MSKVSHLLYCIVDIYLNIFLEISYYVYAAINTESLFKEFSKRL